MKKEKITVARNCEPEGSPSEYLGAEVLENVKKGW